MVDSGSLWLLEIRKHGAVIIMGVQTIGIAMIGNKVNETMKASTVGWPRKARAAGAEPAT